MRVKATLLAGIAGTAIAFPAYAQDADTDTPSASDTVIVVTAQRQNQSLQEVPIAVSAFTAEALEAQQIENASDLQLTLPNVSFTKGNFTGSSFTIRGIGDLCVGVSCDSATAIHTNGSPLFATRLFETEYFDLERIEVLRGPQGTLFGRNATSGVVNIVTAKPDLTAFGASGDFEYGNFNSIKAKAMLNLPIGETLGVRLAGFYLERDGYTASTSARMTTGCASRSNFASAIPPGCSAASTTAAISARPTPIRPSPVHWLRASSSPRAASRLRSG
jgi:iron complex outermembrane recepter protein